MTSVGSFSLQVALTQAQQPECSRPGSVPRRRRGDCGCSRPPPQPRPALTGHPGSGKKEEGGGAVRESTPPRGLAQGAFQLYLRAAGHPSVPRWEARSVSEWEPPGIQMGRPRNTLRASQTLLPECPVCPARTRARWAAGGQPARARRAGVPRAGGRREAGRSAGGPVCCEPLTLGV